MNWPMKVLDGLPKLILKCAQVNLARVPIFGWILTKISKTLESGGKSRRYPLPGAWEIPGSPQNIIYDSIKKQSSTSNSTASSTPNNSVIITARQTFFPSPPKKPKLNTLTLFILRSYLLKQRDARTTSSVFSLVNMSPFQNMKSSPVDTVASSGKEIKETPEYWTLISVPRKFQEKAKVWEWQTKRGKRQVKSKKPPVPSRVPNPFAVLENLSEDEFQKPSYRKRKIHSSHSVTHSVVSSSYDFVSQADVTSAHSSEASAIEKDVVPDQDRVISLTPVVLPVVTKKPRFNALTLFIIRNFVRKQQKAHGTSRTLPLSNVNSIEIVKPEPTNSSLDKKAPVVLTQAVKNSLKANKETPEVWTQISAPRKLPKTPVVSEWQIKKGKKNVEPEKPKASSCFSNPFSVLDGLSEDAFQKPGCRKKKKKQYLDIITCRTSLSAKEKPSFLEATSPGDTDKSPTTLVLPEEGISPLSSTETLKFSPGIKDDDLDIAKLIKNRRRKYFSARNPVFDIKKKPVLVPLTESPETFRKASSPPRSNSPTKPATENEWQVRGKKKRSAKKEPDSLETRSVSLEQGKSFLHKEERMNITA